MEASPTRADARRTRRRDALLFLAMIALIAVTRAPFVSMTLAGEEGEFGRSVVMVDQGQLPRGVIARTARGEEYLIPAGHNAGGYLLVGALFLPVLRICGFTSLLERVRAATGLRACFVALYCIGLVFALALIDPRRRARGALLLGAMTLPALPLIGSVQVNYDGAISVTIIVATLYLFRRARTSGRLAYAAAAGLLLSFGKVEFAIAAMTALILSEMLARRWRALGIFCASVVAGDLFWHFIDPINFNYGTALVTRYWGMQGGTDAPILKRAWTYAHTNGALLWPLYATSAIALVYGLLRPRRIAPLLPVVLTLVFIVVGYHAISWRGDGFPRYFAPCFPLAAIVLAELELPSFAAVLAAAIIFVFAIPEYRGLLGVRERALATLIHVNRDGLAASEQLEASPRDCVTVTDMDASIGFYSRSASFACCFAQWNDWLPNHHEHACP